MARVHPEEIGELTKRQGAEQMIHGGRPMTGYLFIEPDGFDSDEDLRITVEGASPLLAMVVIAAPVNQE